MVIVNPLSRVVGPLPNGLYGLQIRATNSNSDDPPSSEMEHLLQMNQPSPTPSLCRACLQSIHGPYKIRHGAKKIKHHAAQLII